MMKNAVEIENLSKKYRIPIRSERRGVPFLPGSPVADFWALSNVTLEIPKGGMLGVIGRNGSGKSTLLKIVSGILEPTSGSVKTEGRVAALLELGAGFHEELTGMENIFLNGAVLGFSRKEILDKLSSIIEFSGLKDFIYTPIKHYSTGMQARLGFAVAIHMEPEILLIDEVISVGDQDFKYKCISRIGEFKEKKKTIILVTHDIDIANFVCDDIAWLEKGQIRMMGPANQVAHEYRSLIHGKQTPEPLPSDTSIAPPFHANPLITSVRFLDQKGESHNSFPGGVEVIIEINYDTRGEIISKPGIQIEITRDDKLAIAEIDSAQWGFSPERIQGSGKILVCFSPLMLLKNIYHVSFRIFDRQDPKRLFAVRSGLDRFEVNFQESYLRPGIVIDHPCLWSLSGEI
ncbi:ABC transporter ATP-binding protein [Candidatus Sumerlaeota bacterium]|nr:ABC transporter ATP-binding protein [Candidatus Sumerlaeota bacterium]